jgi:hypothetical protein
MYAVYCNLWHDHKLILSAKLQAVTFYYHIIQRHREEPRQVSCLQTPVRSFNTACWGKSCLIVQGWSNHFNYSLQI